MLHKIHLLIGLFLVLSCTRSADTEKARLELMNAERSFSATSAEKGFYEAMRLFKADEIMLLRDRPITDTSEINKMLSKTFPGKVTWEPVFADISASGDLGYTYGPARFEITDSTGHTKVLTSYYLTIWKKQDDGSWKFVMDTGTQPKPVAEKK